MKGGLYLQRLKEFNFLNGKGFALDIGCHEGYDSLELKKMGYTVDAVDIKEWVILGINFYKSGIVDFPIGESKYSFILCNNTLPFIKDKLQVHKVLMSMAKGLAPGGVMFFSFFGHNDAWSDDKNMSFYYYDEAVDEVNKLPVDLIEKSTFDGMMKTMGGDKKHSEIHRFTCLRPA